MKTRVSRDKRTALNREALLDAARAVFLEKGFHRAGLDEIAERAGFSKGVVYSQFESKADLFLALLERRIAERAAENDRIVDQIGPGVGLDSLIRRAIENQTVGGWGLLLVEFRLVAARSPNLNARYAALHQQTVDGLVRVLEAWYSRQSPALTPPVSLQTLAYFALALDPGVTLERAVHPGALPTDEVVSLISGVLLRRDASGPGEESASME